MTEPKMTLEVLAELEHARKSYGARLPLAWQYDALLSLARKTLEQEAKPVPTLPDCANATGDVTDAEIADVEQLALDALAALKKQNASTAPIVRWFMWKDCRGVAVFLELLRRSRLKEWDFHREIAIGYWAEFDHSKLSGLRDGRCGESQPRDAERRRVVELERRDWAVRVLDAWALEQLSTGSPVGHHTIDVAHTDDATVAATRAELGECP